MTVRVIGRELTRVGGALASGINTSRAALRERRGVWLRLTDERGASGSGEASPLPGYSPDSLELCAAALLSFDLQALVLDAERFDLATLEQLSAPLVRVPAARFALETALLALISHRRAEPAWRTLAELAGTSSGAIPELSVSTLLPAASIEDALEAAARALQRGRRTVKLKLGAAPRWSSERALLVALRREFGDELELRLDANQAWLPALARDRLSELAEFAPELIEEPVAGLSGDLEDHAQAFEVLRASPVPVALDESLAAPGAAALVAGLLEARAPLVALVLKPTLLGGFCRCLELARDARRRGLSLVVTHTFDGPLALTSAAALGLVLRGPRAAGLDRHPALSVYPSWPLVGHAGGSVRGWSEPGFGAERALGGHA